MSNESKEQKSEVDSNFPYIAFTNHPAWKIMEDALCELENNSDLQIQTSQRYIVGFLLKSLMDKNILSST